MRRRLVNGVVRPCSCPTSKLLAKGTKDKEHAMAEALRNLIVCVPKTQTRTYW
jgi:hypothetical protein